MKKFFSRTIIEVAAIFLLFGITVPLCALSIGMFDSSEKKAESSKTSEKSAVTTAAETDAAVTTSQGGIYIPESKTEVGTDYVTNLRTALGYKSIAGLITDRTAVSRSVRVANYENLLSGIESYDETAENAAKIVTSDIYDSEKHTVVAGKILASDYSCGSEVVTKYTKRYNNNDASYITVAQKVTTERQTVKPYMGYLLISSENGEKISLCDMFGNILADNMGNITPYYARDEKNRPVFGDGEKYYVFDDGGFAEIEKDSIRVGLFYDFPATNYAPEGIEVKYDGETDSMRYLRVKKGTYKTGEYYKAYNISEKLGVVMYKTENKVRVINTNGYVQFSPRSWYSWKTGVVGQGHSVGDEYTLPDTFGIESIGCAGYDSGWLRLRVVTTSHVVRNRVVSDSYRLVNKRGTAFEIPDGYSLEGYSNGVLLLEKDGKYGFYTINKEWIAQPMFTYATPFIQGLAVVGFEDGTVGMIDTDGNIVLPFVFTSLSQLSSGVIVGYCEGVGYRTFYIVEKTADAE
jgi:hypothetical protein